MQPCLTVVWASCLLGAAHAVTPVEVPIGDEAGVLTLARSAGSVDTGVGVVCKEGQTKGEDLVDYCRPLTPEENLKRNRTAESE